MYQRSNFQQLLDLLAETFQEKNLAEIQYGDSARALLDWMKQMASQVSLHSEQVSEAYELSRDRMAIKKLDEQAERTLKAQKDNEKKLTNFVLSQGWELRKKIKTEIKEVLSARCNPQLGRVSENYACTVDERRAEPTLQSGSEKLCGRDRRHQKLASGKD